MRAEKEAEHKLTQKIARKIEGSPGKAISFKEYMEMCLYDPDWGYYMNERAKVGKEGDFYTSSSVGSVMGEMLAQFMYKLITDDAAAVHPLVNIAEWGGGNGRLAAQILDEFRSEFPQIYRLLKYIVIEQSPFHRQLQERALSEHAGRVMYMSQEEWFANGDPTGTIVLSNELLDAFAVHRVRMRGASLLELYVAWDEGIGTFREEWVDASGGPLEKYLTLHGRPLKEGQTAEINLAAPHWIERIGTWLKSGYVITVDYGDTAEEIYGPHRMNGTLVCYHRHVAHDNPYIHVGRQDITSHVNFTACIAMGQRAGLNELSFTTQKQFLLDAGIMDKLQEHYGTDPFDPIAKKNRSIRQLLLSDQMSELFKVLVQKKKR
jgi:SAM-dependent MidA family methyltransferase